ncbi:MAG: twin-arginine translocase TatA/TatE family subunit [Myxococcota bacterium]
MFGLGFGEMVVLGVVLLVVVGPRELPRMLKSAGAGIRRLRQMSTDLRAQSGIDDILEDEGLREDLQTIRSLSRNRSIDGLVGNATPSRPRPAPAKPLIQVVPLDELKVPDGQPPDREQEYPVLGPDAAGALADDADEEALADARSDAAIARAEAKVKAAEAAAKAARAEADAKLAEAEAAEAEAQALLAAVEAKLVKAEQRALRAERKLEQAEQRGRTSDPAPADPPSVAEEGAA